MTTKKDQSYAAKLHSEKMVKIKQNQSFGLLILLILISCGSVQTKQSVSYKNISEYFDFNIELSQDTVLFGDEISLNVIFKNKTDTCYYFHPEAYLCIDRYISREGLMLGPHAPLVFHYLGFYDNIYYTVLLGPSENYTKTYTVKTNIPLFKRGKNRLVINYVCRVQRTEPKKEYDILYGILESPVFELYVKER